MARGLNYRTELYRPPAGAMMHIDTTKVGPRRNAETIYETLVGRELRRPDE